MSARVSRGPPVRASGRRKRPLQVDLNVPPSVNHDIVGTSAVHQASQAAHIAQGAQPGAPAQVPVPIDVDAIDDDVAILSPRAFEEAKNKARRVGERRVNAGRIGVMLVADSVAETSTARGGNNNHGKRRRVVPNQPVIDCEAYVDLANNIERENCGVMNVQPPAPPPLFSCPICMNPFTEEMSTKCGHIFCKGCIKAAIAVQKKCPTCRRKLTMKDVIRIYLPTTS